MYSSSEPAKGGRVEKSLFDSSRYARTILLHMSFIDFLVLVFGSGLILFILWFFFGKKDSFVTSVPVKKNDKEEVTIVVEAGYQPNRILAQKNVPFTIIFDRRDKGECTEQVIFPKMRIRDAEGKTVEKEISLHLPEGEKTSITFTPLEKGVFEFMCGMGMNHGKLEVR